MAFVGVRLVIIIGLIDVIIGLNTPSPSWSITSQCNEFITMNDYGVYTLNAYSTIELEEIRLCFLPGANVQCKNPRVIVTFLSWNHDSSLQNEYIQVTLYYFDQWRKTYPACADTVTGECDRIVTCIDEIPLPIFISQDIYSFALQSGFASNPTFCDGKTRMNANVTVFCEDTESPTTSPTKSDSVSNIKSYIYTNK